MSVAFVDGFDHYTRPQIGDKGWTGGGGSSMKPGRVTTAGYSSQAIQVIENNPLKLQLADLANVVGFAFRNTAEPQLWGDGGFIFENITPVDPCLTGHTVNDIFALGLDEIARPYIFTRVNDVIAGTPGQPSCRVGHVDTVFGPSDTSIPFFVWNYIELEATSGDIYLNGEVVLSIGAFTTFIGDIRFEAPTLGGGSQFDDIYFGDTVLGDPHVDALAPTSDGTYTDWTPDTGSIHYSRVNEAQLDDNHSYVHDAGTAGHKDSYGFQDLPYAAGTVFSAQLNLAADQKEDPATIKHKIKALIRQAGTDHLSSTLLNGHGDAWLTQDYYFYRWLLDQDPTGSDWTVATVNADEYGIDVVA